MTPERTEISSRNENATEAKNILSGISKPSEKKPSEEPDRNRCVLCLLGINRKGTDTHAEPQISHRQTHPRHPSP